MIKIEGESFSPSFFEERYEKVLLSSLKGINSKYENNKLGFIDLDTNNYLDEINSFVEFSQGKYDNIIVLGIGGSALGARAILTAIKGKYYNELNKSKRYGYPTLHILDNVDPIEISDLLQVINLKKSLFIVISKSGTTIETISQFRYFTKEIIKLGLDYKNHFVIVAGENSPFKKISKKEGLVVFDIPENVGGRFSVLSNVGLLPLALVGIDIKRLLEGQSSVKNDYFSQDLKKNNALYLAFVQYYNYLELKKNITIFFPYISNLNYFSAWYKQLVGESLAKEGIGITLVDSMGVTDQHSQLQLYYDGPDDKLIMFVELEKYFEDMDIGNNLTFGELMKYEKKGVEQSFDDIGKQNLTIKIDKLDEFTLGQMIFLFEMQTAYLGELYIIDAFNQPGVEKCKKIMKKVFEEKGKNI